MMTITYRKGVDLTDSYKEYREKEDGWLHLISILAVWTDW